MSPSVTGSSAPPGFSRIRLTIAGGQLEPLHLDPATSEGQSDPARADGELEDRPPRSELDQAVDRGVDDLGCAHVAEFGVVPCGHRIVEVVR
jgi:hypothetical protein